MGKTKQGFIREEHDALADPTTIFANFDEMAATTSYVQPKLAPSEPLGEGSAGKVDPLTTTRE